MKERKYEIVLLGAGLIVVARHVRTFSSWQETLVRASALNREMDKGAAVRWIARQNDHWPGLYHEQAA
jgi:hypothetical protein